MTQRRAAPRHVLVTGSNGFVGSHLARRLKESGLTVTGASRASGFDLTRDELPLDGVDHVFHVAGLTYVPAAWSDPAAFYRVNADGTVRVLEQCRRTGVSLTYVSAYVYGIPAALPVGEDQPARPNNPYAFSKLAGEEACRFYAQTYGLAAGILRPFNVYGPGQEERFLIPTIARQVLDPAVRDIVVADLEPRRDFVHVADLVEALVAAPDLPPGRPYNVGSGQSWSVGDVIATCLARAGVTKPFRSRGERREQEIPDVVADISAIRAACGWQPRIDFPSGITTVLESLKPC